MSKHTNHLATETSPYLLQHAHNPVDWHPWGDEALEKARKEDKPILVSIGYAACHWCHVMERESFEDESTARIMNENFINIKIDREERPDLDHIYMDAVQAMTGSGGWPLNVFLTPTRKPFFGGTYFPPHSYANRPSWKDVLTGVAKAFRERPAELEAQAENLTSHLLKSNAFGLQELTVGEDIFTKERSSEMFSAVMRTADREEGGFGPAPKFPHTFIIEFLLHHYYYTKNDDAIKQATLSLDKMMMGGIYDQLGGGFARYSTDHKWLAPHFEKMLYDNALLIIVLSQGYQATQHLSYLKIIHHTLEFVDRELTSEDTGFYSALDADSEGVEGKFYVWAKKEIEEVLGEEADLFCEFYNVSESGNWEHQNILHITRPIEKFAVGKNVKWEDLELLLENSRNKLLEQRNKRIGPLLDDKIILGWNALMNTAYSKAFAATGKES
ncbi:MAG TPA: thioredoxin domain-containing protein, partial [Chryseolinea sp.]|nr:thioredoxin domain-containing protein [Chryseolinea sp.]